MYRITGKQKFGAVWADGKCLAVFHRGVAHTDDPEKAKKLKELGYVVEGEDPQKEKEQQEQDEKEQKTEQQELPKMDGNSKRGGGKKSAEGK